jgi:hypothetical protein
MSAKKERTRLFSLVFFLHILHISHTNTTNIGFYYSVVAAVLLSVLFNTFPVGGQRARTSN